MSYFLKGQNNSVLEKYRYWNQDPVQTWERDWTYDAIVLKRRGIKLAPQTIEAMLRTFGRTVKYYYPMIKS